MNKNKADLLLVTVSLAGGTSYMFMKLGMAGLPPLELAFLRCAIAFALTFCVFLPRILRAGRTVIGKSALTGGLLAGVFILQLYGVKATSASAAGFLLNTAVIMVPLILALVERRMPGRRMLGGLALVSGGLFLINGGRFGALGAGALWCIGAAFLYALYIIAANRLVRDCDPISLGVCQLGWAALYLGAAMLFLEKPVMPAGALQWGTVLGLSLVCSAYSFITQTVVQKHTSPETISFMFSLEPVFSAFFAFIFLGERLNPLQYGGAVLIFCGLALARGRKSTGTESAASGAGAPASFSVPAPHAVRSSAVKAKAASPSLT